MSVTDANKVNIVILAAGQGKRMGNKDLPKVLTPFKGRPLISYALEAVHNSGITEKPVVVVGFQAEKVKEAVGPAVDYAYQPEQLGTGHAVNCAASILKDMKGHVLVVYGDMPFITPETIRKIADRHSRSGSVVTMATITVDDFSDWRQGFSNFGRVIRNAHGDITGIVEKKDASPEQLLITECNPAFYCFESSWLWKNLESLKNDNAQSEYYLTDLIAAAFDQHMPIVDVSIDPREAVGINTLEDLELAGHIPTIQTEILV